jgi:predicted N-acetyltransferase YhbS
MGHRVGDAACDRMTAARPVSVRPLTLDDVPAADRIFRLAFGTFLGLPETETFAGDADIIGTRLRAGQRGIGAFHGNELVGSNIISDWGSVGFFGPLTTRPDLWDQGIAKQLMEPTVAILEENDTRIGGLFTFANSVKHVGLY